MLPGKSLSTEIPFKQMPLILFILLFKNNIQPGQRIIVEDDQQEIKQAIRYLFSNHEALP